MRYLQDLVPGCIKITGKAGMLDEIINYVQSLPRQVEVKEAPEHTILLLSNEPTNFATCSCETVSLAETGNCQSHNSIQHG